MTEDASDWPTTAKVILRLDGGWELYDDHGTWRWYSPTKPGFDEELPTEAEVTFILEVRELGKQ
jgi:hypothetical protein